jgi:lipopolysaccharide biosynthesis glycosyltransferase
MIRIFIGYDPKEAVSFSVLCNSITRLSTQPLSIVPLNLRNLPMYSEIHTDGSTEFSYSRFLVPYLADYKGWAIYMDCDMLLLDDISKLWSLQDSNYAVQCVQHQYSTKQSVKFLGNTNNNYYRKNWSSLMLFNCSHSAVSSLTPSIIESSTGKFLHQFEWVDDSSIGDLPIEWNWLADEYGHNANASLLHYTLGSPCFEEYTDTPMAEYWFTEYKITNESNTNIKRTTA